MFGSFTKSTRHHGGSHQVMALEGTLKTIINDFLHEHCSIAKNLLQRVAVYVLLSTSVKNETEHYHLRERKGCAKLLWLAGNDSSMPLWTPKGTQVINMPSWRPCAWSLSFFFGVPMVVSCGSLLWCKEDAVMARQQEQNGQGARHYSIVHLLLLYYSGHDGRIHQ
jgi:hypothetical protein